jgi:sugar phosphate isomerase/epimerase
VIDKVVHVHAKDISRKQADAERGKVTGTAVGCACGDGVIDWRRVIEIIRRAPRDIVMSVECGSIDEAARSVKHLTPLLGG